jgi:hypothetical protein
MPRSTSGNFSAIQGEPIMNEERQGAQEVNPQQLARTFDQVIAAHWRGQDDVAVSGAAWFEAHWTGQAPPEPSEPPSAASVLAGAGSGIRWYEQDHVVFGYVSGRSDGCYRVTSDDPVPVLVAPWEVLAGEPPDAGGLAP